MQDHYERINDLEAEFEQATRSVALGGGSAGQETKQVLATPDGKTMAILSEGKTVSDADRAVQIWAINDRNAK